MPWLGRAVTEKQTLYLFSITSTALQYGYNDSASAFISWSAHQPTPTGEYCHHHLQVVRDRDPSFPRRGHKEAKRTAMVGFLQKYLTSGKIHQH